MTEVTAQAGLAGDPPAPIGAELSKNTFEVKVLGESYEFKIPTLHEEIAIGSRITFLRRSIDPQWDGFSMGLDGDTIFRLRACATFELLLKRASPTWPFSNGPSGGPIVDSSKFPIDKVEIAEKVYGGYIEALNRFRAGGV